MPSRRGLVLNLLFVDHISKVICMSGACCTETRGDEMKKFTCELRE